MPTAQKGAIIRATVFGNNYLNSLWIKHVSGINDFMVQITSDFYL